MYFPGYGQTQYIPIIRTTPGNCGYVQVYKRCGRDSYDLYWDVMPQTNNPPITFAEIRGESILITIDKRATICFFDVGSRQKTGKLELDADQLWGACLLDSREIGVVAYANDHESHIKITSFKLTEKTVLQTFPDPKLSRISSLTKYTNNEVVAYIPAGASNTPDDRDGFVKINIETGTSTYHRLSPSPGGNYSDPPVIFCPDLKMGIRPAYDSIEIKTDASGERYVAGILLFDLETGKKIRTLAAREFYPNDVFEDDDPDYALSCFRLSPSSTDYKDIRDEFLERFEAFAYSRRDKSLWITYQHGLLGKLSLDGIIKSSLIVHPNESSLPLSSSSQHTSFDTPLKLSPDGVFVTFGSPSVTFNSRDIELESNEELVLIPENTYIVDKQELSPAVTDFTWNTIILDATDHTERLQKALEELILVVKEDIDELRDGHLLRFRFRLRDEIIHEDSFFESVAKVPQLYALLKKYIECLIGLDYPLWYNDSYPAGFFAVKQLVLADKSFLPLFASYVSTLVDVKREKDEPGALIDSVIAKYGWSRDTINLILTRAYFQQDQGIDQLKTHLESHNLRLFLSDENKQSYFRTHTLYLSLLEDNFALLQPDEDALFTALETENIEGVEEALNHVKELDIIHPDFNLTALELALELGNREIANLLIDAGAETKGGGYLTVDELVRSLDESAIHNQKKAEEQLNTLYKRKFVIQSEINQIEYNHMLNLQIDKDQLALLEQLNREYTEIQTKIKYANLGLHNFDLQPGPSENTGPVDRPFPFDQKNAEDSMDSDSRFEIGPKAATVYISGFEEENQLEAFHQIEKMLENLNDLTCEGTLRFRFCLSSTTLSEEHFFATIELTPRSASALSQTINNLGETAENAYWYDGNTPCFFFAVQKLTLYDKCYLDLLIRYLKSSVVDSNHELYCLSELIFEIFDLYGWCHETVNLAAYRLTCRNTPHAIDEIRIQIKKGGLGDYLLDNSQFDAFVLALEKQSEDDSHTNQSIQLLQKLMNIL